MNLEKIRKEKNKTQVEVANKLGITYQAYAHYEKERRAPSPEQLKILADYFNVTVDELIGHEQMTAEERASGASETIKKSITPIEDEMLYVFRKIGAKHGIEAQQALITVAEKML